MRPEELAVLVDNGNFDDVTDAFSRGLSINCGDHYGRTALIYSIINLSGARAESVRYLLEQGADPNCADSGQNWTPLHFAARDNRLDIVTLLLDSGAEVDPVDSFGNSPLWRCVMNCGDNYEVVRALLAAGADSYLKNKSGNSPYDIAKSAGLAELVDILGSIK